MSDLIVITFDNVDEAAQVRESLRSIEREGLLRLDDSAIVVREEDGKVHVKNEIDRGVKVGALGGGLLGLFIGFMFFSAIFFLIRDGNPNAIVGVLRPYKGEIYQDTLTSEDEETLRRVLSKRLDK
jgi:uncharacterized membrane protein